MSDSSTSLQAEKPMPRLASIDAYRGFVMFLMMAGILQLEKLAAAFAENHTFWGDFWRFLAFHQSHVAWVGCSLHDMIQPSFSFIVGVALPFSIASRLAKGHSKPYLAAHAFWRAAVLVLLGVFLRSMWGSQTNWTFEDTLTQIGLGYGFLFLFGMSSFRVQLGAILLILVGYWAAFAAYPLPDENFEWDKAGMAANWEHNAEGLAAHWNKNTNAAWAFDTQFMNLFPRKEAFTHNNGGYSTLSFIPTLATMILGLFAGTILRSERKWHTKFGSFLLLGAVCIGLGWALGHFGICPIVKRIWTPSWVLFSGGICFLLLAVFYFFVDIRRLKVPAFPLIVIGTNSIVAYCIANSALHSFFTTNLKIHLGVDFFKLFGSTYEQLFLGTVILLIDWLILFWMYRKKVFVRI